MKLNPILDYDFPTDKKWVLYNGDRYEGDIVWYSTNHPEVITGDIDPGFHLEMMDIGDESNDWEDRLVDVGVFLTYESAIAAAIRYDRQAPE